MVSANIGKYVNTTDQWSGSIDDVRMYNRALTATEIQKLYLLTDKAQAGDCTDTNGAIHPIATEVCDGMDNDCDGIVDEKPDGSICTICERIDLNVPQNECEALWAVFTGTNGSGWTSSANWLTSVDVESWYGVALTGTNAVKNVASLDLGTNNLQ